MRPRRARAVARHVGRILGWGKGSASITRGLGCDGRVGSAVRVHPEPAAPPSPKSHVFPKTLSGQNPKKASVFACYDSVTFWGATKKPVTFLGAACFNPRLKYVDSQGSVFLTRTVVARTTASAAGRYPRAGRRPVGPVKSGGFPGPERHLIRTRHRVQYRFLAASGVSGLKNCNNFFL